MVTRDILVFKNVRFLEAFFIAEKVQRLKASAVVAGVISSFLLLRKFSDEKV